MDTAKTKILIVDDSRSVRNMLSTILEASGYITITAEDGLEALAKSVADSTIDLIVSDVNMPKMDGIMLVKALRKRGLDVPIVMLTGVNSISVAIDALCSGATDYVIKDVNIEETIAFTVKRALEKHQLIRKNIHLERLIEQEVRKNREKDILLLQKEKQASVGQLAAGVAHEINNPMGYIMSNLGTLSKYAAVELQYLHTLEAILKTCGSNEQQAQIDELSASLDLPFILEDLSSLISESMEGAEKVRRIVLDLKDFACINEDGMKDIDLNASVQSTANIVSNEIRSVADLELKLGEIPLIVCNPQQINQVIANLLVNAAHAIDGHGRITVSTSSEWGQVLLTVADTGCGIPLDIQKRIFDPFFTTKEVGKGTGLGLSISYDIIKRHGGEITFESEPGLGTTFMIRLPISGPEEIKS